MAMSRSTGLLTMLVLGLSIACIGLLAALLVRNGESTSSSEDSQFEPRYPYVSQSKPEDVPIEDGFAESDSGDFDNDNSIDDAVLNVRITKTEPLPIAINVSDCLFSSTNGRRILGCQAM